MFETAVADRAILDLSACPRACPERERTTHLHCVSDGTIIDAYGSEGNGITDYDGYECADCKEAVCMSCAVKIGSDYHCPGCAQAKAVAA